ncbi:MAG TPA: hypothetical protein VFG51_03585 [Candidatus Saccharimonadia bacterium]|nr:hypothetical protein [Candidatus Saccharimonadia bacterium]
MKTLTKLAFAGAASAIMFGSLAGVAFAQGPTPGPEAGPGCFGRWRAGSVQVINDTGLGPVGENYFSVRAGDNSTINADNKATCAAL